MQIMTIQTPPSTMFQIDNLKLTPNGEPIDRVIVLPTAVVVVAVRAWTGQVTNAEVGKTVRIDHVNIARDPNAIVARLAGHVRQFMCQPSIAAYVFGDERLAKAVRIQPAILLTDPRCDWQCALEDGVPVVAAADLQDWLLQISQADLFTMTPDEQQTLADVLLDLQATVNTPTQPAPITQPAIGDDEPTLPSSQTIPAMLPNSTAIHSTDPAPEYAAPTSIYIEEPQTVEQGDWFNGSIDVPLPALPDFSILVERVRKLSRSVRKLPSNAEGALRTMEGAMVNGLRGTTRIDSRRLADLLEERMERSCTKLMQGTVVHNVYEIGIAAEDYQARDVLITEMVQELTLHLTEVMDARAYRRVGPVQVTLIENTQLAQNEVEITSDMLKTAVETAVADTTLSGPYLEVPEFRAKLPLAGQTVTIGRSKESDICLHEYCQGSKKVSRVHARLEQVGEAWQLTDNGSANGIYVNGQRVSDAPVFLNDGDRIILGSTQRMDRNKPLRGAVLLIFRV